MSHFSPSFFVNPYNESDMMKPSLSTSDNKRLYIGLYQNVIAQYENTDKLIKASEAQYKESMQFNEVAHKQKMDIAQKQVDATNELTDVIDVGLGNINNKISELASNLDIKFSAILEQQILSNTKIENLISIVKIPEFEKERIFYFSEGFRFLQQTFKNKNRYVDALESFIKAYNINKSDYITSHQIGLIYLYNVDYLDLIKAEEFFLNSVDYGSSTEDKFVALTYQHLAYCQFLQFKLKEASNSAKLGYKIDDSIKEIKLIELECEYLLENNNELKNMIITLCEKDIKWVEIIKNNEILNKDFDIIDLVQKIAIDFFHDKINTVYEELKIYKYSLGDFYLSAYQDTLNNYNNYPTMLGVNLDKKLVKELNSVDKLYEYFNHLVNNESDRNDVYNKLNGILAFIKRKKFLRNEVILKLREGQTKINELQRKKLEGKIELQTQKRKRLNDDVFLKILSVIILIICIYFATR